MFAGKVVSEEIYDWSCLIQLWSKQSQHIALRFLCVGFFSLAGNLCHLTWVRLQQLQEQHYSVLQVHAGSFCVSIIHRTPTWTTRSLTCVHDHYVCVYTWGLGTPIASQRNIFVSKKLLSFYCAPDTQGSNLSTKFYRQVSHPVTHVCWWCALEIFLVFLSIFVLLRANRLVHIMFWFASNC